MIDYAAARDNMIESQVRPNGITNAELIAAMQSVTREHFVPEKSRSIAYMDEDIPLETSSGERPRFLMEPMAFARLAQAAQVSSDDVVLDIGCGTGYSSAVLAQLAQSIVAVESDAALAETASDLLVRLDASNVAVVNASLADGYPAEAPYDVIFINGRVAAVPDALLKQLAEGGRLVAVVGTRDTSPAMVYTRTGDSFAARYVFDASVPLLDGFGPPEPGFVF